MVSPFRIDVPDAVLDDLRDRLARTRWPTQLDGAEWDYGTELSYLQELCTYWRDEFDWRAAEARLNAWPHFETEIDGEHLHFIHARSPHPDALPLVITHGWPGSVCEFLDILGPLTDPVEHGGDAADAFHVVCPSMPGYGWSGPTHQQGWDIRRVAEANATLMSVLGYDRYGAQGGDWGAIATTMIGLVDPEHVMGLHLNMVVAGPPSGEGRQPSRRPLRVRDGSARGHEPLPRAGDRRTSRSRARSRRRSATGSPTHRRASRAGSSRSSAHGVTATGTSSRASRRTSCS